MLLVKKAKNSLLCKLLKMLKLGSVHKIVCGKIGSLCELSTLVTSIDFLHSNQRDGLISFVIESDAKRKGNFQNKLNFVSSKKSLDINFNINMKLYAAHCI